MQWSIVLAWYIYFTWNLNVSYKYKSSHFFTEAETSDLKEDALYLTEEKENGLKVLVIVNTCIDLFYVFIFQSSRHFLKSVVRFNM